MMGHAGMRGIFENDFVECLFEAESFYISGEIKSGIYDELFFSSRRVWFRVFSALNRTQDDFDLWIWRLPEEIPRVGLNRIGDVVECSAKVTYRSEYSDQNKLASELSVRMQTNLVLVIRASIERPGAVEASVSGTVTEIIHGSSPPRPT